MPSLPGKGGGDRGASAVDSPHPDPLPPGDGVQVGRGHLELALRQTPRNPTVSYIATHAPHWIDQPFSGCCPKLRRTAA